MLPVSAPPWTDRQLVYGGARPYTFELPPVYRLFQAKSGSLTVTKEVYAQRMESSYQLADNGAEGGELGKGRNQMRKLPRKGMLELSLLHVL